MYSIRYGITFLLSCTCVAAVFYTYLTCDHLFSMCSPLTVYISLFALTVEIVLRVMAF